MCRTDLAAICKARDDNAGMLLSLLAQLCATLINLLRIFKPETVIGWHRELVRRKWKQKPVDPGGRPPLSQELSDLIIQLAKENTRWGYGKIAGELLKLGFDVSESTGGLGRPSYREYNKQNLPHAIEYRLSHQILKELVVLSIDWSPLKPGK